MGSVGTKGIIKLAEIEILSGVHDFMCFMHHAFLATPQPTPSTRNISHHLSQDCIVHDPKTNEYLPEWCTHAIYTSMNLFGNKTACRLSVIVLANGLCYSLTFLPFRSNTSELWDIGGKQADRRPRLASQDLFVFLQLSLSVPDKHLSRKEPAETELSIQILPCTGAMELLLALGL